MTHTLFISDLHLCEETPSTNQCFFEFCQKQVSEAEALYILGDFFNVYVGDDIQTHLSIKLEAQLKALVDSGIPIYFMHGNRDFFVGKRFFKRTGITFLPDPTLINLYGKKTLLMHGDSLCTKDLEYMKFRRFIRNPIIKGLFLALPKKTRLHLANKARIKSMAPKENVDLSIFDVSRSAVVTTLIQYNVEQLIHGHTHQPAEHDIRIQDKACKRYVLGDWHPSGTIIRADASGIRFASS